MLLETWGECWWRASAQYPPTLHDQSMSFQKRKWEELLNARAKGTEQCTKAVRGLASWMVYTPAASLRFVLVSLFAKGSRPPDQQLSWKASVAIIPKRRDTNRTVRIKTADDRTTVTRKKSAENEADSQKRNSKAVLLLISSSQRHKS